MKKNTPPTYLLLALVAIALLHFKLPGAKISLFPWNLAGAVPLVVGIWFNIAADRAIKRRGTTVKPFEEPTALIADGVFHVSRHPMYLGFILMLAGIAAFTGSLTPWIVVVWIAFVLDDMFIKPEEKAMEAAFGEDYQAYKKRVRKWI
jgi:protein-S-isoprenylcysteine O-methyltransferase Ste14